MVLSKCPKSTPGHNKNKTATRELKLKGFVSVFGSPSKTDFWSCPGGSNLQYSSKNVRLDGSRWARSSIYLIVMR